MPRKPKRLLILSLDQRVNRFLCGIIRDIIGSKIDIHGACLDTESSEIPDIDVVMTSGGNLAEVAGKRFPGARIVAPKRIITGFNLEKILMLPKDKPVLVVNNPRYAAEETASSLKELGIDHLTYIPYWEGLDIELAPFETAISPGMAHICPPTIPTVIDIGPRLISILSFSRLLSALELPPDYLEDYTNHYHQFLMASSRKLSDVLHQSELLRKRSAIVLNQFEEGVISVNKKGRIDLANAAICKMLHCEAEALMGRKVEPVLSDFEKIADLVEDPEGATHFAGIYTLRGKQILIHKIPVISGDIRTHIYTFREIAGIQRLEKDVRRRLARKGHVTKYGFDAIWGKSDALRVLLRKARQFAGTEKTILITGESGTGKELVAHAIHENSLRREGPFVAVNFAGIPQSLIESELFGYEDGAFTGAKKGGKAGLFEQAHGGTIFLDEIGDASPDVQSRLLRVVQEREVLRVGGSNIMPVDVRILAATNADLQEAMLEKRFRKDLFYRLSILPLVIPPLRDRQGDILYLFHRYLAETYNIHKRLSPEAETVLQSYPWPGNIRELMNAIEYACFVSEGSPTIGLDHLPDALRHHLLTASPDGAPETPEAAGFVHHQAFLRAADLELQVVSGLLRILQTRKQQGLGRNSLRRLLRSEGHEITEGRMKTYLRTLQRIGLVHIGTTRQGTRITSAGEMYVSRAYLGQSG